MTESTFKMMPNNDSRRMHPLPWRPDIREEEKCITLESPTRRAICSFWGADIRYSENYEWCTKAQMEAHARYGAHAMNNFPLMQSEIERIYQMEDMPEDAIKAIEALMEKIYFDETPPQIK